MGVYQHRWFHRAIYTIYWWESAALELNPGPGLLHLGSHDLTVEELAKHSHTVYWHASSSEGNEYACGDGSAPANTETKYAGGDAPHNNIPPSRAIYAWFRIA